jgi:plasmid stabilization system protein ParE
VAKRPIAVRITAGAENDLAGIYQRRRLQRADEGPDGADALLDRIVAGIEGLADWPERGPIPPELQDLGITAYRQLSLPRFRVIYLPAEGEVTVMIVADARRDFRTLLEERLLRRS